MRIPDELWILLYFENDVWNAHALNLDIVGSDVTPREAFEELKSAVLTQLAYAVHTVDLDLVEHRAPDEYFVRWKAASIVSELGLGKSDLESDRDYAMFVHLNQGEIQRAVEETSFERYHDA